jgi:hypothetical protein
MWKQKLVPVVESAFFTLSCIKRCAGRSQNLTVGLSEKGFAAQSQIAPREPGAGFQLSAQRKLNRFQFFKLGSHEQERCK